MAQPTSQLVRPPPPSAGAAESDEEDVDVRRRSPLPKLGQSLLEPTADDDKLSALLAQVPIATNPTPPTAGPQPMGYSVDFLTQPAAAAATASPTTTTTNPASASALGYSSQLPPLLVPQYYLPLTQQIQQLQQQNQLQQELLRQHQTHARLRQLQQDLQLAQQQQQLAQLQHEQLQRERARLDPLAPFREDQLLRQSVSQDALRQSVTRGLQPMGGSVPSAGSQPTSTLHQVHSVGAGSAGSQLPPVSTQLWNPYLMMSDPYLTTGLAPEQSAVAASLAALQAATFYQTLVSPATLLSAGTGAGGAGGAAGLGSPSLGLGDDAKALGQSPVPASVLSALNPKADGDKTIKASASPAAPPLHPALTRGSVSDRGAAGKKKDKEEEEGPAFCEWDTCKREFPTSRQLAEHVRQDHGNPLPGEDFVCKWRTCKRQSKPFPIPQQFLRHMQTHTREKPYQCKHPGCGQTFTQANVLAAHTRTHTGERPFECSVAGCGKKFAYANCLLAHHRSHTGEKPRVCKVCGKGFSGLSNLTAHMRTHTGERPYECKHEDCGKSFTTSSDLVRHTRIHTGLKPFVCKVTDCNKRFTTSSQLNNHLRTHTGERPYPCKTPGCDKRFADLTTLRRHEQSHERKKRNADGGAMGAGGPGGTSPHLTQTIHQDHADATLDASGMPGMSSQPSGTLLSSPVPGGMGRSPSPGMGMGFTGPASYAPQPQKRPRYDAAPQGSSHLFPMGFDMDML